MRIDFAHIGDEAITATGNREDEAMFRRTSAECLAQRRDRLGQIVLLDHPPRPHGSQQIILADHAIPLFDQVRQNIQCLGRYGNRCAAWAEQLPRYDVHPIAEKLVLARFRPHSAP